MGGGGYGWWFERAPLKVQFKVIIRAQTRLEHRCICGALEEKFSV